MFRQANSTSLLELFERLQNLPCENYVERREDLVSFLSKKMRRTLAAFKTHMRFCQGSVIKYVEFTGVGENDAGFDHYYPEQESSESEEVQDDQRE